MAEKTKALSADARETIEGLLPSAAAMGASYELAPEIAEAALAVSDLPKLIDATAGRVRDERLVFPETELLIERAVVGLLGGNLVLHGPPGTGKTHLARLLAEAFDVTLAETTGTPDWSTYDVIGGLRPGIGPRGSEVLQPWLGNVTAAALQCGRIATRHIETTSGPQAHWLLIDELSRADIDKALGPLYTALSGHRWQDRALQLWFETSRERASIILPARFRLVGTMNDVDTAFVNQLSQGLQRRFNFVFVGVPAEAQTAEELQQLAKQAATRYANSYGHVDHKNLVAFVDAFTDEDRVTTALAMLGDLVGYLRWNEEGPRWPVGSAQIGDVLQQFAIRAYGNPEQSDLSVALDLAVADQLIPIATGLTEDEFEPMEGYLASSPFTHAARALKQLRTPQFTVPS